MSKIFNRLIPIICLSILLVSGIGCATKTAEPTSAEQFVPVQLGNLSIIVSADGNLVMPQAYDLRFGTPGNVKEVLVEEGDFVKEGQVLARLDDTPERLDIRSSNSNVQTVLSNLYETVPRLPQFPSAPTYNNTPPVTITIPGTPVTTVTTIWTPPGTTPLPTPGTTVTTGPTTVTTTNTAVGSTPGTIGNIVTTVTTPVTTTVTTTTPGPDPLNTTTVTTTTTVDTTKTTVTSLGRPGIASIYPFYYPNATTLTSLVWAQNAVYTARELLRLNKYAESAAEMDVAIADLDLCRKIIEDTIKNPKSGLGYLAPFIPRDLTNPDTTTLELFQAYPFEATFLVELRQLIDSIKQCQADIGIIRALTAEGKNQEAAPLFEPLFSQVKDIGKVIIRNINLIETHNYGTIYGEDSSLYLYDAAEDSLNRAFVALGREGLDSAEFRTNLRIAQQQMAICNSILGTNDYVLQHGLSLKAEQQYKVDLQNAIVSLENKKDDFLKTVILAPFDGTVVSVGFKKNDVLSSVDYSSGASIQLVDTTTVKFEGLIDEIDIMRIKTGQKAKITVDAVPDKTFTGTVTFISPYGSKDTGSVVKFPLTIELDPTDVELRGSLTATADITIYDIENVLLLPVPAITTTPEGAFVTIMNEATGQPEKRQVKLGQQNFQFAEVLDGLHEGDKVLIEEKAVIGAPVFSPQPGPPRRQSGGGGPP